MTYNIQKTKKEGTMLKAQLILSGVILLSVNCGAVTTNPPVCMDGEYGPSCEFMCGQCNAGSTCDKVTGLCAACLAGYNFAADPKCTIACSPGTYGDRCSGVCSENCTVVCNHMTGHCTSCRPGWTGPFCSMPCSGGAYGPHCNEACGQCKAGTGLCDTVTGHCPAGCQPGYEPTDPLCKTECADDTYGSDCSQTCGECEEGTVCDKENGRCPQGCRPGYDPNDLFCQTECPANMWGQGCANDCGDHCTAEPERRCDKENGHCVCQHGYKPPLCVDECDDGAWGQDCQRPCGPYCTDVCNKANGVCNCQPGYIPSQCTDNCNGGRYGQDCVQTCGFCHGGSDTCDHVTGYCTRCQDNREMPRCVDCVAGNWGPTCGQLCGQCGGDGRCDPLDGTCLSLNQPCQDGWTTPACDTKCDEGSYGKNCGKKCGHCRNNAPCRHDSGICEQDCDDGYTGVLCQTEEESLVVPIVGSVIGAGLLIALAIIVVAICYAKRFKSNGPQTPQKDFTNILPADTDPSSSNPHHGQHEALSLRESQVYQNMPAPTSATLGPHNNYDQTDFSRQDSHTYDTHNPPAGKLPHDPPVSHTYQNTEEQQPSATTGPGVAGFPRGNVAKGGRVVEESVPRSPAPEENYGNLSYPAQDAPYGNLPVKKSRGGRGGVY